MIYCFLANGFEEVEALTPVDCLRRCEVDVKTVGIGSNIITGSHGVSVLTDLVGEEIELNDNLEMIILPGGMPGTINLEASPIVKETIKFCADNNKIIGAICAAPSILGHMGLLEGKKATCFPGFESQLAGAEISSELACCDGNIITAKGAGAALQFSEKLIEKLISEERAEILMGSLQCK